MEKTIIRNMTEGSVFRQLVAFSLPLLLANSLQTLYATVDTLVVGRFVGTAALCGVYLRRAGKLLWHDRHGACLGGTDYYCSVCRKKR